MLPECLPQEGPEPLQDVDVPEDDFHFVQRHYFSGLLENTGELWETQDRKWNELSMVFNDKTFKKTFEK